jgi:hypothetical protein
MADDRITVRLGVDLMAALDGYATENGLDRAAVVRLAVVNQLKRKPPKSLPEGVERVGRNPDPSAAGKAGAAARWKGKGKRKPADG